MLMTGLNEIVWYLSWFFVMFLRSVIVALAVALVCMFICVKTSFLVHLFIFVVYV